MSDWLHASASELARAIRSRRVSSQELVDAHLARIEEVNGRLNAVVALCAERARAEAREADRALERGWRRGPLHGVPMTVKDSLDTEGVVSTWGTRGREGFAPDRDATVVARLRAAGAILLGKTNTPEFTLAYETDNAVYGRTSNPWAADRTCGGSSGGAGAIVAVGGAPFDVGSDTGGSIRVPAHFCGIAGLKPTSGRVPRTGHAWPAGGLADGLTTLGPLARRVEDLALLLPLLSGPDWCDPAVAPVPLGDERAVDVSGLRVAVHLDNGIAPPTAETTASVRVAADALARSGARVEEARPPDERTLEVFLSVMRADGGAQIEALLRRWGTRELSALLPRPVEGVGVPDAASAYAAIDAWDRFRSEMLGFLRDWDALVCPANAGPALPHGESGAALAAFSWTQAHNLTGWPAAVVRAGTSPEGLPIGVQLVARPWREDVALALARGVEEATGGWSAPPLQESD